MGKPECLIKFDRRVERIIEVVSGCEPLRGDYNDRLNSAYNKAWGFVLDEVYEATKDYNSRSHVDILQPCPSTMEYIERVMHKSKGGNK